jgi:hypothetical protein
VVPDEGISVMHASMQLEYASDVEVRYKSFNLPAAKADASGKNKLYWEISNLPAFVAEPFAPPALEVIPRILFALKEFEISGYAGSNESWEKFGSFMYKLISGKDELPADLKEKVKQLTAGQPDTYSKVAALYTYLQQNTRYISIQLGIGGWVPFDAAYVHQKKYGDCKALANFMFSLLKEAGIPSVYALIKAGSRTIPIETDFSTSQFNHAILCVPDGKDTIWLECTSQDLPAGYLGDFTSNRYALLVKESGSKLVKTPEYPSEKNLQLRKATATINDDGNLLAEVSTTYKGLQYDDVQYLANHLSEEKKKEHYAGAFELGTYEIADVQLKAKQERMPSIDENFRVSVFHYAQQTGKRLILAPNVFSQSNLKLSKDSTRRFDVQFRYGYSDIDSVEIRLGEGYRPESLPKPVKIESDFATYESMVEFRDGSLHYFRRLQSKAGRFPAARYAQLVDFFNAVSRADKAKAVLVKQSS